ncbi:TPA: DUF1270 family protein, partial [Staphylococcus aureus]|nr:DUF1270 family protein [Staphylococcus aureus]HCX2286691.1 DUF1270 family protein [Staphylococcus aureus]HCX3676059.1 DUF1270 family protein [Staphylococcus aureus]HDF6138082.1 DUF1270 family protein [Staphylococcus aureus]HDG4641515.1 DUF1270 family protein [Staphylococcus aureus]
MSNIYKSYLVAILC